jgi:mannose-1-phosphate guanylyltransferase/mannose-6-phosphate isomerase
MSRKIIPVILCGGSGTRLWPMSRQNHPKQFLHLAGNRSLFHDSVARLISLQKIYDNIEEILIVTNENHRFIVLNHLQTFDTSINFRIILEPEARNTAPALTLAALAATEKYKDSILIVCPADHFIKDDDKFLITLNQAVQNIKNNTIITIGICPLKPDTGFGYIKFKGDTPVKSVESFTEKPSYELAINMLKSGNFAWNAGIFILYAQTWLNAINLANSEIYMPILQSWKNKIVDGKFERPDTNDFKQSQSDSIDYAVMEKANQLGLHLNLVEMDAGWSDLGSFNALEDIMPKDENDNLFLGKITAIESKNNIAISNKRNISLVGVENIIVIETADAVLVVDKSSSQSIKKLVSFLEKKNNALITEHQKVFRPWGWFEVIDESQYYKVKRIQVFPKSRLSYQSHEYRNEHWVVVKGRASIICDAEEKFLDVDQSTYIKKQVKHQLINNEQDILEVIEVQTGSKLSEDDIERYDDIYGR